jgi:hypothetical protein
LTKRQMASSKETGARKRLERLPVTQEAGGLESRRSRHSF